MQIIKRTGVRADFDSNKIYEALRKCFEALGNPKPNLTDRITVEVEYRIASDWPGKIWTIAEIQTAVERELLAHDEVDAAHAYITYKAEHAAARGRDIPEHVRQAFDESAPYFPTALQGFQFYDKYSRWDDVKGRRETWVETVDRVMAQLDRLVYKQTRDPNGYTQSLWGDGTWLRVRGDVRDGILQQRVMPSMRMLAMAGPAVERNNASAYNCCYTGVDSPQSIVEILTLLMCGCGVGFSVERRFVDKLPPVGKGSHWKQDMYVHAGKPVIVIEYDDPTPRTTHVVEDSSEGWAAAVQCGLLHWWAGNDHMDFDYSKIRAAGTPLRTKGGTASGPGPLRTMLANIRGLVLAARGRHLLPIEVHDMVCMVADCVVSGGVRRSATISLFDWEDRDMWEAKSGNWFETAPWRANANNSVVWPDRDLTQVEVMDFVLQMVKSGYGEPGIFSRRSALATMPARRLAHWTEEDRTTFGINPCGEVLLKNKGFCNLSICVARAGDTIVDLAKKVALATVVGTIQSCATKFEGLSAAWTENAEQERLLGVDITGQADRPLTESEMGSLKEIVLHTNRAWAEILGVNESAATTVVKPSGNSSVLLNCSPGINPRWSRWQIRNVRVGAATPMYRVLREAGVPMDPENGQDPVTANRWVAHFPVAAPEGALTTRDVTALGQCDIWMRNKLHWTEHNPSTTVTFRPDEVIDICKWLYDNQRIVGGMAFLPASDHKYAQAPNEELTEAEYDVAVRAFPQVDFALLYAYEQRDETTSTKELACMGGVCMLE